MDSLVDPVVVAAGGALVGAMATDAWQRTRDAVAGWWRSRLVRPGGPPGASSPGGVEDDRAVLTALEGLREAVLVARRAGDVRAERELAERWTGWLRGLLAADPILTDGLRRLLEDHLAPALGPDQQEHIRSVIMHGTAYDHGRVFMAGRDQHITGT
ncbi:hypothetical protein ACFRCG_33415 [Embleya sp. NPDC056575]|uniref:hypothetical protein n=1 Tax=unclassified Embleya TaxID=2699296 RepID=UPI0036B5E9FE